MVPQRDDVSILSYVYGAHYLQDLEDNGQREYHQQRDDGRVQRGQDLFRILAGCGDELTRGQQHYQQDSDQGTAYTHTYGGGEGYGAA